MTMAVNLSTAVLQIKKRPSTTKIDVLYIWMLGILWKDNVCTMKSIEIFWDGLGERTLKMKHSQDILKAGCL